MLAKDPDIDRIYIIENEENKGLLHKLEAEGFKPVVLPFYKIKADLKCSNKFSVIVQLQGMGLHIDPARLKNETYTNVDIMEMLQAQGINVGSWAPGILNGIVENRTEWGLQLIPMDTYKEWFESEIPENLRANVTAEWGEPWSEDLPQNKSVMIYENETGKYIVIPTVRFGNVWLMVSLITEFYFIW